MPILKPCPFCGLVQDDRSLEDSIYPTGRHWSLDNYPTDGSPPKLIPMRRYKDRRPADQPEWGVYCPDTRGGCTAQVTARTRDDAIALWNRRDPPYSSTHGLPAPWTDDEITRLDDMLNKP